jgi:MFS family permease
MIGWRRCSRRLKQHDAPQAETGMTRANGHAYGWVVVGAGALMTCVAMGSMFSLAVFLQPMSVDTGWSRTGISTAMTIDFLVMGLAAFAWGALSDRYGARIVVLLGSLLLGLGLVLASRATSLGEFQLLFGGIVGLAAGAFYAPMMTVAAAWFEHNRSLAVALVSAGMGVAPLTVAPFARWLITNYEWRPAMLVIGITAWILLVPAALLVRPAPAPIAAAPIPGVATPVTALAAEHRMSAGEALRTPQFAALALAHFACCAAHSGPIFHMVTYAIGCGIPVMAAVTIYSLAGVSAWAVACCWASWPTASAPSRCWWVG